MHSGIKYWQ